MRISMNIPDDLLAKVDKEASFLHFNRTQYFIKAVSDRTQADAFLRINPDVNKMLLDCQETIANVQARVDEFGKL